MLVPRAGHQIGRHPGHLVLASGGMKDVAGRELCDRLIAALYRLTYVCETTSRAPMCTIGAS